MEDPVAASLGAAADGVIEDGYLDAVKLTAHSCATLAGAYRMTLLGLLAVLLISYLVLVEGGKQWLHKRLVKA